MIIHLHFKCDPVSELITDAVALTVLPDITTFAVRANMVEDALCIGSLAVNVTFIVSPDFASVAFELLDDTASEPYQILPVLHLNC